MEREGFPLFSGPGHIFLFYCFIAFCLFAPHEILHKADFHILFVGLLTLGFPLGALINAIYSCVWNLIGGYVRVGHSKELYNAFKGRLSMENILAIHDKKLWDVASSQSIEYFRRRWAHYHFSMQIATVSIFAIPIPFLMGYLFSSPTQILSNLLLYPYMFSLLLISIGMFLICSKLSKSNRLYISQLLKGYEQELKTIAEEEIKKLPTNPP